MELRKRELNRERQRRWRHRQRVGKVLAKLELNVHGQQALIAAGYLDANLRLNQVAIGRAIVRVLEDALGWTASRVRPALERDSDGK